jgi:prevent-host-death family protein
MQSISAKEAKYGFGRLIDLARAEPVTVEKHGRPVVVVLAIEEYEKLREIANEAAAPASARVKRPRKSGGTVNT